jgi:peptidyl-tRNA hydrolase
MTGDGLELSAGRLRIKALGSIGHGGLRRLLQRQSVDALVLQLRQARQAR